MKNIEDLLKFHINSEEELEDKIENKINSILEEHEGELKDASIRLSDKFAISSDDIVSVSFDDTPDSISGYTVSDDEIIYSCKDVRYSTKKGTISIIDLLNRISNLETEIADLKLKLILKNFSKYFC